MSDTKTPAELGRALRKIAALMDEFGSLRSLDGSVQSAMRQAADVLDVQARAEPDDEPSCVFLVATGETHNGEETYTRHDDAPPPLCDFECLYTRPAARKVQPLTDEQMLALVREYTGKNFPAIASPELWFLRGIKAAQRPHGITE